MPLGSIVTAGRVLGLEAKGDGISGGEGGGEKLSRTPTDVLPSPAATVFIAIASSVEEEEEEEVGLEGEDSRYLGLVELVACGTACAWRPSHSVLNAEIILKAATRFAMMNDANDK